jgi:hypothetical protein
MMWKRVFQSYELLFWRVATVVAVAAVVPLLLVGTKTVVMEPLAAAKTGTTARTVVAEQPPRDRATAYSAQKKPIVNPNRAPSYESEADVVAKDTVVRYGPCSAAPHRQPGNKPPPD